mmetsp:Transcript_1063/g.3530  ORF Transcript_1063/g.3530 Transcript_1063/m.3530 type:complete len:90 (+) Transcript_1063:56-325(+)
MRSDLPGSDLAADVAVRTVQVARTTSPRPGVRVVDVRAPGATPVEPGLVARFAAATADRVLPNVAFPPAPFSSLDDFCPFLFTQCVDCE